MAAGGIQESPVEIVVHPVRAPAALPPCRFRFPDPRHAGPEGLVASGGDLEPSTIIGAYRQGIFPWPYASHELLWWSPEPRAILPPERLHVSRRLGRTLRQGRFRVTVDAAFDDVVAGCADREETWITPALRRAYGRLHRLGWAHSVEVWADDGRLAGGLYGVAIGGLFAAESMFHRVTDASKVAVVAMVERCRRAGVTVIDVQLPTPHLVAMGAVEVSREDYLARAAAAVTRPIVFPAVEQHQAAVRPPLEGGPHVQ